MTPLDFLLSVERATLSGILLLLVMLLCFFSGFFFARLSVLADAKALWEKIKAQRPAEDARPDDDETASP